MTSGDPCSKCREEDVEALADTAVNQRLHGWERAQAVNALVAEVARLSGERDNLQRQLDRVDEVLGWKGTGRGRVETVERLRDLVNVYARLNHSKAVELGLTDRNFDECQDPMCVAARAALSAGAEQKGKP